MSSGCLLTMPTQDYNAWVGPRAFDRLLGLGKRDNPHASRYTSIPSHRCCAICETAMLAPRHVLPLRKQDNAYWTHVRIEKEPRKLSCNWSTGQVPDQNGSRFSPRVFQDSSLKHIPVAKCIRPLFKSWAADASHDQRLRRIPLCNNSA